MALFKQIFGSGSGLLCVPRGICRGPNICRNEAKTVERRKNSLGIYKAWSLLGNKSDMRQTYPGSADVSQGGVVGMEVGRRCCEWTWDM